MQMQGSFNANQYEPNQGFTGHPPAQKVPFTITNTAIKQNRAGDGGYFEVEFTSPAGVLINLYNIWSKTPKAVEIAHGQLSALCRAVSRFQVDWSNEGAALRGATGLMDVGYQKGHEPTAENPQGGYTELKKVYDAAGNDPSRPGANAAPQQQQQPQQQPQSQPMTQQPGGGWGAQQAPQAQAQPQQQAPQGQPGNGQAWQPGASQAPAQAPPWGNR